VVDYTLCVIDVGRTTNIEQLDNQRAETAQRHLQSQI
jgi:hypothetical protein